jgi:5-carboxymethyl-2-hydroxymuconate isomerase
MGNNRMPHCLLEYSKNIPDQVNFEELFIVLHATLAETGEFNVADFKSRAICYDKYLSGNGRDDGLFVHLDVRILEGRPDELKSQISGLAIEVLGKYFGTTLQKSESSLTVQITDISKAGYKKLTGKSR